jgi:hypothetical protein
MSKTVIHRLRRLGTLEAAVEAQFFSALSSLKDATRRSKVRDSTKVHRALRRGVANFKKANGRLPAAGDFISRASTKVGPETAEDNLSCVSTYKDIPPALLELGVVPIAEDDGYRLVSFEDALFDLEPPTHKLVVRMPKPSVRGRTTSECEPAFLDVLLRSGALEYLTGVRGKFENFGIGQLQSVVSKGLPFLYRFAGRDFSTEKRRVEVDGLLYSAEDDYQLALEAKRVLRSNSVSKRQIGNALLTAMNLSDPASRISGAFVYFPGQLFQDDGHDRGYADSFCAYVYLLDMPYNDFDGLEVTKSVKVIVDFV